MAMVRCPRCSTLVEKPAYGSPVCTNCGFGSSGGAPAAPPAPPADPYAQDAGYGGQGFSSPPSGYGAPVQKKTSGMAVAGFVLAIVSWCIGWIPYIGFAAFITWILGLIFSIVGMSQTKNDPNLGGRGLAIAGLVISLIGVVFLILMVMLLFIFGIAFLGAFADYCDENPEDCATTQDDVFELPAVHVGAVAAVPLFGVPAVASHGVVRAAARGG